MVVIKGEVAHLLEELLLITVTEQLACLDVTVAWWGIVADVYLTWNLKLMHENL